ncbi:MAG: MFS transporter [Candidatus Accumulibacter sp.]|jgi:MFS family permease|nr:MFS transporter [Accumulibacter sp.]
MLKLLAPFAVAYFLSYHFRTLNTVIGPILREELALSAAEIGFLSSAYFIAFGAAQLPLGILLDRFGARRVESALLLIAAIGAGIFASARTVGMLAFGRAMIGIGVSACLMAALKCFANCAPPERQASLTGWIMTSGSFGALAASTPLDFALRWTDWRAIFLGLAIAALAVAALIFFNAPEQIATEKRESLKTQIDGLREVFFSRNFWRFAPVGLAQVGGFMSVQSLWSSAWLIHVNGHTRSGAAQYIATMSVAMMISYSMIGLLSTRLARRGISTLGLLIGGMSLSLLTLALIITRATDQHYLLWAAFGLFSSCGTMVYPLASACFPPRLSGRASTTVNLLAFTGAFGMQWGMGLIIDLLQERGYTVTQAYQGAFIVLFCGQFFAWVWLIAGGKNDPATKCASL